MMDYKCNNEVPVNMVKPVDAPNIVELMQKNRAIAEEGLIMARRINACLIGNGTPEENISSPACLIEDLMMQNCTLNKLLEELTCISERLGL